MKIKVKKVLLMVSLAVVGSFLVAGCRPKDASDPSGVGERTGAAIDRATEKTKDMAGAAVEKTGEVLEKAGTAVEKTGTDMQK